MHKTEQTMMILYSIQAHKQKLKLIYGTPLPVEQGISITIKQE